MTDRRETESTERRLSAMLRTAFCPVVRAALNAETTIEVMVNPDGSVWIEEAGRGLIQTGNTIAAGDRERVIRLVASSLSAGTSSVASIVSAELPGTGERFEGILPPVSAAPCYSIRKLARAPFTLADYVQQGALSPALADKLKALVTQNVYDTVRGQHLLIPQGSRLLGRYQSEVSFGQDRALVVWDRILMPDGSSITISEPGSDVSGY
ncbi:MAG: Flp pilus assembly complex ATPase component TadA, partial [Alphaproteobacteria bacterium]|nr:Flp pilus assembly complex ATPase component TadA [Alphaproteobacteria bacterium]